MVLMVPALFVWIPGDYLCAGTAELAVGQVTPGAVRLTQSAFTLFEIAVGVLIAAELSNVGTTSLFESTVPPTLPDWFMAVSWIVFTLGLVLAFSADSGLSLDARLGLSGVGRPTWRHQDRRADGRHLRGRGRAGNRRGVSRSVTTATAKDRSHPRGFFALTVGALALRMLAVIDGGQHIQGFNDLRDAITQTLALTVGLVVGALSVGAFLTRILGRREVLA